MLGPAAQAGVRRRRARGAALLVAGEVRHPRTGAVRRDPGRTAWLAHVEMAVEKTRRVRAYGLTCRRGNGSEEHTSELQSLMRISYAVYCLKQTTKDTSRIQ